MIRGHWAFQPCPLESHCGPSKFSTQMRAAEECRGLTIHVLTHLCKHRSAPLPSPLQGSPLPRPLPEDNPSPDNKKPLPQLCSPVRSAPISMLSHWTLSQRSGSWHQKMPREGHICFSPFRAVGQAPKRAHSKRHRLAATLDSLLQLLFSLCCLFPPFSSSFFLFGGGVPFLFSFFLFYFVFILLLFSFSILNALVDLQSRLSNSAVQHMVSSSLTIEQTWPPCIWSVNSYPNGCQAHPFRSIGSVFPHLIFKIIS